MSLIQLAIPYRSQWDRPDADDHESDCGPTCVAMLLNGRGVAITPDETYQFIGPKGSRQFTSFTDLRNAALGGGLTLTFQQFSNRTAALDGLKATIDAGKSMIALVKYAEWRERTGNQFSGGHFVVVTGYDDSSIYIHDPLFGLWAQRSRGEHYRWSKRKFLDGWGGFAITENPNFSCLITNAAYPFATNETIPDDQPTDLPEIDEALRLRILSLAAYEGEATPDLTDPATAVHWLEHLGTWGEQIETYVVLPGDTFSGIARRFYHDAMRWRAIQKFNQLPDSTLFVGQRLQVPMPGDRDPETAQGPHQPAVADPDVRVFMATKGGIPRNNLLM